MSRDSIARAYASITFPISLAALAAVAVAALAFGAAATGALLRTAVVFGGATLAGGVLDDAPFGGRGADAAPPFAGGFTAGCVVVTGGTLGAGGDTVAGEDFVAVRRPAGGAGDAAAGRSFGPRGASDCGTVDERVSDEGADATGAGSDAAVRC